MTPDESQKVVDRFFSEIESNIKKEEEESEAMLNVFLKPGEESPRAASVTDKVYNARRKKSKLAVNYYRVGEEEGGGDDRTENNK
ncbi:287_t:CDS:1, partial [Ambispora leptoticha]